MASVCSSFDQGTRLEVFSSLWLHQEHMFIKVFQSLGVVDSVPLTILILKMVITGA